MLVPFLVEIDNSLEYGYSNFFSPFNFFISQILKVFLSWLYNTNWPLL